MERTPHPTAVREGTGGPALLLRLPDVMKLTGLGRSTIYRMVADQSFPRPVRLAVRAVAWRRFDLD